MQTAVVGGRAGSPLGPGLSPANPGCCFHLQSSREPGEPNQCHHGPGQALPWCPHRQVPGQQQDSVNWDPVRPHSVCHGKGLLRGCSTGDTVAGASTRAPCRAVRQVPGRMKQPPGFLAGLLPPHPRIGCIPPCHCRDCTQETALEPERVLGVKWVKKPPACEPPGFPLCCPKQRKSDSQPV